MAVRKNETFPPVTMGHIRSHGCRDLLRHKCSGRGRQIALATAAWKQCTVFGDHRSDLQMVGR
jgi:hypothetical protein